MLNYSASYQFAAKVGCRKFASGALDPLRVGSGPKLPVLKLVCPSAANSCHQRAEANSDRRSGTFSDQVAGSDPYKLRDKLNL